MLHNKGESICHVNKDVEGRNFEEWKDEFPVMWKLVPRSFTEDNVKGYYTFVDRKNRTLRKYITLVQVPRTPSIVCSVVNIGDYFVPVHQKIKKAGEKAMERAQSAILAATVSQQSAR